MKHGALVLALTCLGTPVIAQISPGPLAKPHEQLEGALQCAKCHGGGRKGGKEQMQSLCLDCHKEIAWLVERTRGFHAGVRAQRCSSCHPDHGGKDFALISWPGGDQQKFDHAAARWPLEGGHRKVKCADCHKPTFRVSNAATLSARRAPDWGWVGLERRCASCHEDVHRGRLGTACDKCHVAMNWQTINKSSFDHDKTKYPLRGRHAQVACDKCHNFSAGKAATNPLFAKCTDCHKDDHAGTATLASRVVDCAACHTVSGWQPSTYTVAQHRLAKYPLEGRHEQVKCIACHVKAKPGVPVAQVGSAGVVMRPAASQCRDCHADDHGGQLARRPDRGACATCHTVKGWKPSTYTAATHATLRLRLEGRHAEIECRACHGPDRVGLPALPDTQVVGRARVMLAVKEVDCAACHVDPHDGRLPRCGDCHGLRTFRPSTVGIAAHQRYKLPLEGAHRAVPCVACHKEMGHPATRLSLTLAGWSFAPLRFAAPAGGCAGCHESPHGTQFAQRRDRGACESCHGVDGFRPAARFDHDRDAAFSLKGAHARVPCNRCHSSSVGVGGKPVVKYRPVPVKCEACHDQNVRRGL